jgi:CIC family chloride channel protein
MASLSLDRIRGTLRKRGTASFLAASLVVGIAVGAAAALLIALVRVLSDATKSAITEYGTWILLLSIPIGIGASWLIARVVSKEVESGGVTETMVGLSLHGGYLSTKTIIAKLAATATTLGFGGSGGREGPIVMIGGAIGSTFARYTRFGEDQIRSLVAAGAGAGIGASFSAPIAGMLFAMEVLLGNFAVRHLNAIVVASVAAAVTTNSLVGEDQILTSPAHQLNDIAELFLYALLGLLAVGFGVLFLKILHGIDLQKRLFAHRDWIRPLATGLIVALIGLVDVRAIGTGQEFVAELVRLPAGTSALWLPLFGLAVLKMVTNSATRSGGGSAGTFMPSLFIGAAIGAGLAILVSPIWTFSELEPGAFAVVGMAATFAATARAPLTAILIVFEITGDYGLVLPLMLATALATIIADRIHPENSYLLPLRRTGVHLIKQEDIDLLDTVTVGQVMRWPGTLLQEDLTTSAAEEFMTDQHHHGMPVVVDGKLTGILTLSDIARRGDPDGSSIVKDVMTADPITVVPSMPVSSALARMAALGYGRLPVVADDDPQQFVGMFRRESVVRAYHLALGGATGRHLYRDRAKQRAQPGASFFEVSVPARSLSDGALVRDLSWPEGATLVSIRRGQRVIIPHGETQLRGGDIITAFGTGDSRIELAAVLENPAESQETEPPA